MKGMLVGFLLNSAILATGTLAFDFDMLTMAYTMLLTAVSMGVQSTL